MNNSSLFNEKTFYDQFLFDLRNCKNEVIIESPFITTSRMSAFFPIFSKLLDKGVNIYIVTRDPEEHESYALKTQAEKVICEFEKIGVQTLLSGGNHHRKLAILDREILWEGSLNILSQNNSREIMRRIDDEALTLQMFKFLRLGKEIR